MESLLADDFIITVEDGTTFSKTGYLAHTADSELRVQISVMSDIRVRMHGSIAIVTGAYHEKGTSKGRPYEYHDRFTDVGQTQRPSWMAGASLALQYSHKPIVISFIPPCFPAPSTPP